MSGLTLDDRMGLAKTEVDAHTLGLSLMADALEECGVSTIMAMDQVNKAFSNPSDCNDASLIEQWINDTEMTALGFSYRLDPDEGVLLFQKLMYQLEGRNLFGSKGSPLKLVAFAGLPPACDMLAEKYNDRVVLFYGDETPVEALAKLGLESVPGSLSEEHWYDVHLEEIAKEVMTKDYSYVKPVDRSSSKNFGRKGEKVTDRIQQGREAELDPLIRAHAGPYQEDRIEAVKLFVDWTKQLADEGLLDVLSIGSSQLSQSMFGEAWNGRPNGGGVPINSPAEFDRIWNAARPMFVRTYAGTKNIRELAEIYEESIDIAWHALSLWWFSQIDGRGPNSVMDNLEEHFDTMRYIASTGKPLEANVPHHFAFRGSDDTSYVASAYLSAKAAKTAGISDFILQIMLNNPKQTWAVNDLAKARATLKLVKELEDDSFRVYVQTRCGLDYLSHDAEKAKMQLAKATLLMDDIDPFNYTSPDIVHVVSYSEGTSLATPEIINESIKITRAALDHYRSMKKNKKVLDICGEFDEIGRQLYLEHEARCVIDSIERKVPNVYSPGGLHRVFEAGFFPVPLLAYCRDEFPGCTAWQTKIRKGCVDVYDGNKEIEPSERIRTIEV